MSNNNNNKLVSVIGNNNIDELFKKINTNIGIIEQRYQKKNIKIIKLTDEIAKLENQSEKIRKNTYHLQNIKKLVSTSQISKLMQIQHLNKIDKINSELNERLKNIMKKIEKIQKTIIIKYH